MDLSTHFSALACLRFNIKKGLEGLTLDQLNKIPDGFNNNLIWHYGHIIATQQLLCYKLSGKPMYMSEDLVNLYRKGTKPEGIVTQAEYEHLQALDAKTLAQVKLDYENKFFSDYKSYTTSFGMTLESTEDAIAFNNVHEGMHLGNIMSMRRLV